MHKSKQAALLAAKKAQSSPYRSVSVYRTDRGWSFAEYDSPLWHEIHNDSTANGAEVHESIVYLAKEVASCGA